MGVRPGERAEGREGGRLLSYSRRILAFLDACPPAHPLAPARPLRPSLARGPSPGSMVGYINPSSEEVAVPQQPHQNHSSRYLPSFLHVWHVAVESLALCRAPTNDAIPFSFLQRFGKAVSRLVVAALPQLRVNPVFKNEVPT